jgi:flagellar hook-associated protein 3 FlgL
MTVATFTRLGTTNTYDNTLRNLHSRQASLANLQENLTSGKRVVNASDDPTSAAQAERALTRIERVKTDQRALESQRNAIAEAESTLGTVTDALQNFRELVVAAGNPTYTGRERQAVAVQLQGLRDQIFDLANRKDSNGMPLFSALGSALAPFVGPNKPPQDYTFQGLPGQSASSEISIPYSLDGESAFMHQTPRDGVFNVHVTNATAPGNMIPMNRSLMTDNVMVTDNTVIAATATATSLATTGAQNFPQYIIKFNAPDTTTVPGETTITYDITESPPVATAAIAQGTATFKTGVATSIAIKEIPGMSLNLKGIPEDGDTITIDPSGSVFNVLDSTIRDLQGASNGNAATQAVSQALHNIDIGMGRVSAERGRAGDLLNRADRITSNQEKRNVQLEADRSRAEDLDMIKGVSDFQNQQTAYSAALQSYAQIQKLSLFNFLS